MTRRRLTWCCLMLPAAAVLGGTWPSYHGVYALDGYSDAAVPDKPALLWTYKAGAAVSTAPVSDGTRIYVANSAGDITALTRTGEKVWSRRIVEVSQTATQTVSYTAPLLLAGSNVMAVSGGGKAYALAADDGHTVWTFDTADSVQGAPTLGRADGVERVVILTQPNGGLFGVDAATGRAAWTNSGSARADGHLASTGDSIVFGSCAAGVHIVSFVDGTQKGFIATGEGHEIAGGVAVNGDQAFTGTRSGHLVALSLKDEKELWRFEDASGELFTTPAVSASNVAFATGEGNLVCVKRSDGTKAWSHDAAAASPQSPVIAGNRVLAALDGTLYLYDLADGKQLWTYRVGDGCTSPALVGGLIVVGGDDGTVRAFGARP